MHMNYRSVADLNEQVVSLSTRLPRDVEVVVGIPRSGLLPASLLALHLNLPLTDVEGLVEGKLFSGGFRVKSKQASDFLATKRNVLVVDDSVGAGNQLRATKQELAEAGLPHTLRYAAVYMMPGSEEVVDFFCEPVPYPRVFEWNFMHHGQLSMSCMALEGVLCREPSPEEKAGDRANSEAYRAYLESADPLHLPTKRVGWIVSCRPETARARTRAWLERHGVAYEELIMLGSMGDAQTDGCVAQKAAVYKKTGARLFIERALPGARSIAEGAGRPVFCVDTREMIYPGVEPKSLLKGSKLDYAVSTARVKVRRRLRGLFGP